jgi:tetratricopeptide (TPR) repeat protein
MHQNAKFWIGLAIFQIVFGVTVFALTRNFYMESSYSGGQKSVVKSAPNRGAGKMFKGEDLRVFDGIVSTPESTPQDPAEISRLANAYFADGNYEKAAQQYERLLSFNSGSAHVHNNLGISLHYIGRSADALQILDEGITVEPTNQRIWLTLGFVNKSLGNVREAKAALTKAMQMNPGNEIGKSATAMLAELP